MHIKELIREPPYEFATLRLEHDVDNPSGTYNAIWDISLCNDGTELSFNASFWNNEYAPLSLSGNTVYTKDIRADGDITADGKITIGNKFIVNEEGDVGIGTIAPETELHIHDGVIKLDGTTPAWTSSPWRPRIVMPTGSSWTTTNVLQGEDYKIGIGMAQTGWYFIEGKENGDVRYPFRVGLDGYVHAGAVEIRVASWPDYVFEPEYDLKPIEELEKYINENNHLPDVPTEAEVLENGLNLGETDALLLKKIEELTLYITEVSEL